LAVLFQSVVAGDRVSVLVGDSVHEGEGDGVVVCVQSRLSLLQRPSSGSGANKVAMKAIASNLDQMLVLTAAQPEVPASTIDRCIVAALRYGIEEVAVVVNKMDLPASQALLNSLAHYSASPLLNYKLLPLSLSQPEGGGEGGLAALREVLAGKTSILVGQSGVGKSSLINALVPLANIRTGGLVKHALIGSHTTSNARLHHLPGEGGGAIIDSPGIRELGVWHLEYHHILSGFKEIDHFSKLCRFRNCKHSAAESKFCAVWKAIDEGHIHPDRFDSFQSLVR
jgi:ribosome biogenesis GTPase